MISLILVTIMVMYMLRREYLRCQALEKILKRYEGTQTKQEAAKGYGPYRKQDGRQNN